MTPRFLSSAGTGPRWSSLNPFHHDLPPLLPLPVVSTAPSPADSDTFPTASSSSPSTDPFPLLSLPPELILLIADHVPIPTLTSLLRTSRSLSTLLQPLLTLHALSTPKVTNHLLTHAIIRDHPANITRILAHNPSDVQIPLAVTSSLDHLETEAPAPSLECLRILAPRVPTSADMLSRAAMARNGNGPELLKILLPQLADVAELNQQSENTFFDTPLLAAAERAPTAEAVRILLAAGADPGFMGFDGSYGYFPGWYRRPMNAISKAVVFGIVAATPNGPLMSHIGNNVSGEIPEEMIKKIEVLGVARLRDVVEDVKDLVFWDDFLKGGQRYLRDKGYARLAGVMVDEGCLRTWKDVVRLGEMFIDEKGWDVELICRLMEGFFEGKQEDGLRWLARSLAVKVVVGRRGGGNAERWTRDLEVVVRRMGEKRAERVCAELRMEILTGKSSRLTAFPDRALDKRLWWPRLHALLKACGKEEEPMEKNLGEEWADILDEDWEEVKRND